MQHDQQETLSITVGHVVAQSLSCCLGAVHLQRAVQWPVIHAGGTSQAMHLKLPCGNMFGDCPQFSTHKQSWQQAA